MRERELLKKAKAMAKVEEQRTAGKNSKQQAVKKASDDDLIKRRLRKDIRTLYNEMIRY